MSFLGFRLLQRQILQHGAGSLHGHVPTSAPIIPKVTTFSAGTDKKVEVQSHYTEQRSREHGLEKKKEGREGGRERREGKERGREGRKRKERKIQTQGHVCFR